MCQIKEEGQKHEFKPSRSRDGCQLHVTLHHLNTSAEQKQNKQLQAHQWIIIHDVYHRALTKRVIVHKLSVKSAGGVHPSEVPYMDVSVTTASWWLHILHAAFGSLFDWVSQLLAMYRQIQTLSWDSYTIFLFFIVLTTLSKLFHNYTLSESAPMTI